MKLKDYILIFLLCAILISGGILLYKATWSAKDAIVLPQPPRINATLPTVPLVYPDLIGKG